VEKFSTTCHQELLKPEVAFVLVGVGEQFEELIGLRWTCTALKTAIELLALHLLGVELLTFKYYVPVGFVLHASSP
jgi:hypothetical protein